MKICKKCKEEKALDQFNSIVRGRASKLGGIYVASSCKECVKKSTVESARRRRHSDPEKTREKDRNYRLKNARNCRSNSLKYRFGITADDYDVMYDKQQGCCAICGIHSSDYTNKTKLRLHVDHCHTTGMIRGLLCNSCNTSLGGFKDSEDVLNKAIAYINIHTKLHLGAKNALAQRETMEL